MIGAVSTLASTVVVAPPTNAGILLQMLLAICLGRIAPDFNQSRVDGFGLITGQIGYAWNNVLFYVKGGAAVTGDRYDAFDGNTGLALASANDTRWGGTVGAGLEFGFAPNWSLGVEYDHLFMGTRNTNLNDLTGA
jgi:outer membrane immunogenic protein